MFCHPRPKLATQCSCNLNFKRNYMICFLTTNYLHPYEIYYLITACITQNRTWGICYSCYSFSTIKQNKSNQKKRATLSNRINSTPIIQSVNRSRRKRGATCSYELLEPTTLTDSIGCNLLIRNHSNRKRQHNSSSLKETRKYAIW